MLQHHKTHCSHVLVVCAHCSHILVVLKNCKILTLISIEMPNKFRNNAVSSKLDCCHCFGNCSIVWHLLGEVHQNFKYFDKARTMCYKHKILMGLGGIMAGQFS